MKQLIFCALLVALAIPLANAKTDVLCIYYPEWHVYPEGDIIFGKGQTEWNFVNSAKPFFTGHDQPVRLEAGNPDDSNPADVAKEIDLATAHGIDAFVYDWYWADHHPIQHEGLERGFLKAPNREKMKFALMWANHNRSDVFRTAPGKAKDHFFWTLKYDRAEFLEVIDYCIKTYFREPNYYRLGGKLYFAVYSVPPLVKGVGGIEAMRETLAEAQRRVAAAGLPAIHFAGMFHGEAKTAQMIDACGFDSTFSYNCTPYDFDDTDVFHVNGESRQLFQHEEFVRSHAEFNARCQRLTKLPFVPNVTRGWDCTPRCQQDVAFPFKQLVYPYYGVVTGLKPSLFGEIVRHAKAQADADPKKPGAILINAWNEYTEGCYLMPDRTHSDGFLKALRTALNPSAQ